MNKKNVIMLIVVITILSTITIYVRNVLLDINYSDLEYTILSREEFIDGEKSDKNRGYEIVENNNEYYLIIYHGEEPVVFGDLEVLSVEIDKGNVKVEVRLPFGGAYDAFSYPKAEIKFNKKPRRVKVIHKPMAEYSSEDINY